MISKLLNNQVEPYFATEKDFDETIKKHYEANDYNKGDVNLS